MAMADREPKGLAEELPGTRAGGPDEVTRDGAPRWPYGADDPSVDEATEPDDVGAAPAESEIDPPAADPIDTAPAPTVDPAADDPLFAELAAETVGQALEPSRLHAVVVPDQQVLLFGDRPAAPVAQDAPLPRRVPGERRRAEEQPFGAAGSSVDLFGDAPADPRPERPGPTDPVRARHQRGRRGGTIRARRRRVRSQHLEFGRRQRRRPVRRAANGARCRERGSRPVRAGIGRHRRSGHRPLPRPGRSRNTRRCAAAVRTAEPGPRRLDQLARPTRPRRSRLRRARCGPSWARRPVR